MGLEGGDGTQSLSVSGCGGGCEWDCGRLICLAAELGRDCVLSSVLWVMVNR